MDRMQFTKEYDRLEKAGVLELRDAVEFYRREVDKLPSPGPTGMIGDPREESGPTYEEVLLGMAEAMLYIKS